MNAPDRELAYLKRMYPTCYSSHCFYDDGGIVGIAYVYTRRVRLVLRFRSGRVLDEVVFHSGMFPDWGAFHWRDHVAQFVSRRKLDDGTHRSERANDVEFASSYPAIHEHLTLDWLDGAARQTSSLGISIDAGQWKARLADRDNGLVAFCSADGFYAVLDALERQLASGTCDWREDRFAGKAGKPKR
jgi:hypothetical protein